MWVVNWYYMGYEEWRYDFNDKFISNTALETNPTFFLHVLYKMLFQKKKTSMFFRTKNHVNMDIPINLFINII